MLSARMIKIYAQFLICLCTKNLSPQIIKDFYLLGRGELFQAFIDTAQHMLKTPPTAVTEHGECCLFTYQTVLSVVQQENG